MSVILGLNFGDEGKGLTTSFLCSQTKKPLVVRANGGHQAGHTVVHNGNRHVFSSFGAGTLQGVPTYWSSYCTFSPISFLHEFDLLKSNHIDPIIYVNPLCPVTTPFDIGYNRAIEKGNRHGSVGVGFGATIQRQENYYKLFVQDLFYESVLVAKLKNIASYYRAFLNVDAEIENFLEYVREVKKIIRLSDDSILKTQGYIPVFEGAQGILLDMDFGFFPNVTRSNTTSKNALNLYHSDEIYYVTRSYLTRHGNGFLPNEKKLDLINNEHETNKTHEYQGEFRTAQLNVELLNYALACDNQFSRNLKKNLIITCADQFPIDVEVLLGKLNTDFNNVYVSKGDSLNNISLFK